MLTKTLNLTFFFILSFLLSLFGPVLFPSFKLFYFAPFLCTCFYHKSYSSTLWISLCCGLILDLLSAPLRFGLYALNYTLTSGLLYSKKQHFFEDELSTLPILTFLFSVLSTLIQVGLLYIFDASLRLSWNWVSTDLLIMPSLDGVYAFICFNLPILLFGKTRRKGKDYFMS